MPDALDAIRALGGASVADPEPVAALRARTARRRRRQRAVLLPLAAVGLVAVGLVVAGLGDDGGRGEVVTVDDPTTTTTAAPTTTLPPATSTTGAAPTRRGSSLVVAGLGGVELVEEGGSTRTVVDQPATVAYGIGTDTVVVQEQDLEVGGPAVLAVHEGSTRRVLARSTEPATVAAPAYSLLDVGLRDGRPVAVVSSTGGPDPDAWEVHVLLLDLATGARTDLGVVAGWEEGVTWARLLPDGDVVFTVEHFEGSTLQRRSGGGDVVWNLASVEPSASGAVLGGAKALQGDAVAVLQAERGAGGAVRLEVRRFALADGAERPPLSLDLAGQVPATEGLCSSADTTADGVLCSRSFGGDGAVAVDLRDGTATLLPAVRGRATVWR